MDRQLLERVDALCGDLILLLIGESELTRFHGLDPGSVIFATKLGADISPSMIATCLRVLCWNPDSIKVFLSHMQTLACLYQEPNIYAGCARIFKTIFVDGGDTAADEIRASLCNKADYWAFKWLLQLNDIGRRGQAQ